MLPLNRNPASTEPTLPPAPTIPATAPRARLLTNGTTEYVAPFDILMNRPVNIIAAMAKGSTRICENSINASPSRENRASQQQRASAQSPAPMETIADDAAQRAGKQVHHAEGAGHDSRGRQRKMKSSR